ncbi:MAG: methyltransferase domain-containing protein [Candidatus Omnitrophota bacterium]
MNNQSECEFCGGKKATVINTYKHYWVYCTNCGNIVRRRKKTYLLEFIPKSIFLKLPKGKTLFSMLNRNKDKDAFYDYYLGDNQGQGIVRRTKWEGELESLTKELSRFDISLQNKRVLDISGGPGFLVQDLKNICKEAVVTEYSQVAVDRMKDLLKVNAVKFDYDTDKIGKVVNGKFDIVLIRASINFCLDIRKMLVSLKNILHQDSIVYVSFTPPTLGACLRWQFDDYTYHILYNPETLARLFAEEGLVAFAKYEMARYHYLRGRHLRFLPLMIPYQIINSAKNCNRELMQKCLVMIFRKNPSAAW